MLFVVSEMRSRKALSMIAILFVFVAILPAKVAFRPEVDLTFGGAFCYPTADYLKQYPGDSSISNPPIRTSWYWAVDFNPAGLYVEVSEDSGIGIAVGVSYLDVSPSLAYGISIIKPYDGFGFDVHAYYQLSGLMTLGAKYRYMNCRYTKSRNHFLSQDVELVPSFHMAGNECRISVSCPVTASFKADAVTLRVGIGCAIAMDVRRSVGR